MKEGERMKRLSFYITIGRFLLTIHGMVLIYILFIGWNSILFLQYELLYFGYSFLYYLVLGSLVRNWKRISCIPASDSEGSGCPMCNRVERFLFISLVYYFIIPTSFQYYGYAKIIRMGQLILSLLSWSSFSFMSRKC